MALNLEALLYLQGKGLLSSSLNKILDVGPQNVYFASEQQILEFARSQGTSLPEKRLMDEVKRISYFSTPRPDERTSLLSEITDLANIEYAAFDVCPAPRTELLDLNFDRLPAKHREHYDVVLNFGTTEHVFNQWNCFELMHDAARVGGIIYCQLPGSGYLEHGYYCYTPLFFRDLASANAYEVVDLFFHGAGMNNLADCDVRDERKWSVPNSSAQHGSTINVPCINIHAVLQKTQSAPFRVALEVATAHSAVDKLFGARYRPEPGRRNGIRSFVRWLRA